MNTAIVLFAACMDKLRLEKGHPEWKAAGLLFEGSEL